MYDAQVDLGATQTSVFGVKAYGLSRLADSDFYVTL